MLGMSSKVRLSEARAMAFSPSLMFGNNIWQPEALKHWSRVTGKQLPLNPIFSLRSNRSAICTAATVGAKSSARSG